MMAKSPSTPHSTPHLEIVTAPGSSKFNQNSGAPAGEAERANSNNHKQKRCFWWHWSYIGDWLTGLVLLAGLGAVVLWWDPHVREFHPPPETETNKVADNVFTYSHQEDSVPVYGAFLMNVMLPCALILLASAYYRSLHDMHNAFLGFFETVTLVYCIQVPITRGSGVLRPDFAERLATGDADLIKRGRLSFPSGHAAIAFASMIYISLYFTGKLMIFRPHGGSFFKCFFANFIPLAIAVAASVSRLTDNRHHPVDIVGGAIIGISCAIFGYHLNFHSLSSEQSHLPKLRLTEPRITSRDMSRNNYRDLMGQPTPQQQQTQQTQSAVPQPENATGCHQNATGQPHIDGDDAPTWTATSSVGRVAGQDATLPSSPLLT